MAALLAAFVIVAPVFLFALAVGIVKDGSPFRKEFWS